MDYYTVAITVGEFSTTVDSRTPAPDPAAGAWVLDGLQIAWRTSGDDWPPQVEPMSCSLGLWTTDKANLPDFTIGDLVTVAVEVTGPEPLFGNPETIRAAEFAGRLTDADAEPSRGGVMFSLVAADHLADLGEVYIGAEPWPQETASARQARMAAAAGVAFTNDPTSGQYFHARDIDHQPALQVFQDYARQVVGQTIDYGWFSSVLVAVRDTAGAVRYGIPPMRQRQDGNALGLTTYYGGHTTLQVEDNAFMDSSRVYQAAHLTLADSRFRKDKGKTTNRVVVTGRFPDDTLTTVEVAHESAAARPITLRVDSDLVYPADATLLGQVYLGDENEMGQRWALDSFVALYDEFTNIEDADGLFPKVLDYDAAANPYPIHPVGHVVVVTGIPDAQNMAPRPWVAGQLTGAELQVQDGEVRARLSLRPTIPRQQAFATVTSPPLTPASLRTSASFATLTYKDKGDGTPYLDPTLTYYDMRLATEPPQA